MNTLLSRIGLWFLRRAGYPTCLNENCTCAYGWPCLDCDPTDTEETHICPGCGREHYFAEPEQDLRGDVTVHGEALEGEDQG